MGAKSSMETLFKAYEEADESMQKDYKQAIIDRRATGKTMNNLIDAATIIIREGGEISCGKILKMVNDALEKL